VLFQPFFGNDMKTLNTACVNATWMLLSVIATSGLAQDTNTAPFPGKQSDWHGFVRYDFEVDEKPVVVVAPAKPAAGKPWVWHGEFFGHKPEPDIALLKRGFHVAYMRVPDMLGSPTAVAHWNAFYNELTTKYGLAKKVALVGLSRGGLYCYNWAAANPDKVACIYGDAPVCDFKSWPGGRGKGKGSPRDWQLVLQCYGFKDETEALAYDKNPVDNLAPLAAAQVPLLHVYGDADEVVPWDENTGVIAQRYRQLGGSIKLIAKPRVGHHPHGLDDPTPIVEFIAQHAIAALSDPPTKTLILPGVSIVIGGRPAFVLLPEEEKRATPQPWIMYAPTLPPYPDSHEKWMHEQFTAAGVAVAGIDVGEAYGSPQGRHYFDALYRELTENRGFATKPCLLGRSRGGLWVSSWAIRNTDKVAGLAGIYPVFDLRTYPGLERAAPAFGLTPAELQDSLEEHNPIAKIDVLAKARVPVFIIHGDDDKVVPLKENSATLVQRYQEAGAGDAVKLMVAEGQGHNFWPGFFRCQELVDFALRQAQEGDRDAAKVQP
jgi:pimeloyl-ACP methyl ester carboxylesterase